MNIKTLMGMSSYFLSTLPSSAKIKGLHVLPRKPFEVSKEVIRLDFVPFGYFLALSVSFPRSYALS